MMISADLAAASVARDLRDCSPRFVKVASALCCRWKPRLARNGRDWHTLLEFCGLVGTIIVDEDGVYDPASPNDRLLLGMKGTMSEMELSVFRQRSIEAIKQKARWGELFLTVAVGHVKSGPRQNREGPRSESSGSGRPRIPEVQRVADDPAGFGVLVWLR
jgi:DNA invertase Pin-like site-specific DNA recombinase